MTRDQMTAEWAQYFARHPAQTFFTLRLPKATSHLQAVIATRNILLDLSRTLKTEISAVGVFVGSNIAAERHCHLILDSDCADLQNLSNAEGPDGTRPALPLTRKHRQLDHADALDISPIIDKQDVDSYLAHNLVSSGHPQTDILQHNQARLLQRAAA